MAYIGNRPEQGNFRKCDAITTSATATYNLLVGGVAVNPNQNQCIVSLNGVIQSSGNSYTIASSQITFASTLASSDVIDFILILGDTLDVGVPSDDTVDASKITANIITGQTALGAIPADTDELLISDAGTLKRVDYSYVKSSVVNRPNAFPLAYNGNMEVAQYGTSATGLTNGSSGYKTVDRWKWHENGSPSSAWTMTQETLTSGNAYADGFNSALKIDCTTAQGSLGTGDTLHIEQRWEKQDLGAFKKGTANAQKFTIAFWVKATKTGTNIVELQDEGNDRAVSATYTVSTTDTWEHKVVSFPADTTGNFGTGNGLGLILRFYIFAGTDYTSGSLQTSWGASSTTKRANGQVNNADSTSNNWHLTGFQMEVGEYTSSTIPPFQHESYGDNLARCQRYYLTYAEGSGKMVGIGASYSSSEVVVMHNFPTSMRTAPTLEINTGSSYYSHGEAGSVESITGSNISIDRAQLNGTQLLLTSMSANSGDAGFLYTGHGSSKISYKSEL
jgi:hypothetical protein